MYLRRDEFKRTVRAPAKLNVYLELLGRRSDGFHELETLIIPVRLWDSLSIEPTPPAAGGAPGEIVLTTRAHFPLRPPLSSSEVPPTGNQNLVVHALELLRERSGCRSGARVELVKRIPMAAGMGGGSSDAAAALTLANRVWGIGWNRHHLAALGAELGSDVPFFVWGRPAICRGRGERVEPLGGIKPVHVVIVKPIGGLSTSDVYRAHQLLAETAQPAVRGVDLLVSAVRTGRLREVGQWMSNRLERAAATLSPWVGQARHVFEQLDCLGHQLSGSGSAYFGVCRNAGHARRVATMLRTRQLGLVYATQSCH